LIKEYQAAQAFQKPVIEPILITPPNDPLLVHVPMAMNPETHQQEFKTYHVVKR